MTNAYTARLRAENVNLLCRLEMLHSLSKRHRSADLEAEIEAVKAIIAYRKRTRRFGFTTKGEQA